MRKKSRRETKPKEMRALFFAARSYCRMHLLTMVIILGVTEALKADDQMEWVRRRNSIHSRAEEIVLHELVYAE